MLAISHVTDLHHSTRLALRRSSNEYADLGVWES